MDFIQPRAVARNGLIALLIIFLSGCDLFNKDKDDKTVAPTAAFTVSSASGTAPLTVTFSDQSESGSDDIYQWLWDFGDGETSSRQHPEHQYTVPGNYTVSLTVTSEDGADTATEANAIVVEAVPPTADFSSDVSSGDAPLTVVFTDSSTQGTGTINQWLWDFGDGKTSTEQSPTHIYTEPGEYSVSLTVSDEYSSHSVNAKESIVVTEVQPTELTLIDSPVNGISYECGENTGVTEQGGKLYCFDAPVTFSIGNMPIGTLAEFPADLNVYLQDLLGVSRDQYRTDNVVKLARLIQSLDDDGVIAEAINIPAEIAAEFSSTDSLEDDLSELIQIAGKRLVSKPFALAHLKRSYEKGNDATDYRIDLMIEDASATSLLVASPVQLTFTGAEILDAELISINQLTLDSGLKIASLYLRNPPEDLQDLKIIAKADGYFDTGTSLVLTTSQKRYTVNLKLVKDKEGLVAGGVFVAREDISSKVSGGVVTEQIEAETDPGYASLKLKVTVPAGTEMTDDAGNLIDAEEINLVRFNPYAAEALDAYPGGLDVIANVDGFEIEGEVQSGQAEINFKTAGFATITIEDAEGNKAKHFSQDLEIAMQFYTGTMDADGNIVEVGDIVPVWGYNEDTGEWSFEKNGVVQDLDVDDGFLDVVYQVNHLTSFNLDWHLSQKCTSSTFRLTSESTGDALSLDQISEIKIFLEINSAPTIRKTIPGRVLDSASFSFFNTPANFAGSLKVYDSGVVNLLGEVQFNDACASTTPSIEVVVDLDEVFNYEKAKEMLEELRSRSLNQMQQGLKSITAELKTIGHIISELSALDDERAVELFSELVSVVLTYAEAFMDETFDSYQTRLATTPFINTDITAFNGYGCLQIDLATYIDDIEYNFSAYQLYGGNGPYSLIDMVDPFLTRAAEEYIAFFPGTLSYSAYGIDEFVKCGNDLVAKLAFYSVGEALQSQILEHYEPVIMLNVQNMRSDVDTELAYNLANNGAEYISESTAGTFAFILGQAVNVGTELKASGLMSDSALAEIQSQISYLQALRDSGKVFGGGGGTDA